MDQNHVRKLHSDAVPDYKSGRQIEAANLPIVLNGAAEHWPAIANWDPAKRGLNYLKNLAGSTVVQAITSDKGSAFYGHLKGHERVKFAPEVAISFGGFIDRITSGLGGSGDPGSCPSEIPQAEGAAHSPRPCSIPTANRVDNGDERICHATKQDVEDKAAEEQLYLAQVPIFSKTSEGEMTLSALMEDIAMPMFVKTNRVTEINLWMSMGDAQSSTHYDPYHNLLCVVAGEKKVTLWPPSAAPFLYPLPISGEASNHSGVDFLQPDYKAHPLFKNAIRLAQHVTLHPGDALFIPEGWYHQVDNTGVTIAVNFWWPSKMSLALGTHMDAYFLRRVIVSLMDHEKERILNSGREDSAQTSWCTTAEIGNSTSDNRSHDRRPESNLSQGQVERSGVHNPPDNLDGEKVRPDNTLGEYEGEASMAVASTATASPIGPKKLPSGKSLVLKDLTAQESDHLKSLMACNMPMEDASTTSGDNPKLHNAAAGSAAVSGRQLAAATYDHDVRFQDADIHKTEEALQDRVPLWQGDLIAGVFSTLPAPSLQRILLVMANQFPRTLQTLMTSLSPVATEILTKKLEELDATTQNFSQAEFYEKFYGAFDDAKVVMDGFLDGKEAFADQALRNVMIRFLGLTCFSSILGKD